MLYHVVESQIFSQEMLERLFKSADEMKLVAQQGGANTLKGKVMISLFYEPSTRTRFSFEVAMHRLGGGVITTDKAGEFSSAAKGETLADTIRVVSAYGDVIVLRHSQEGAAKIAAGIATVPVINAGDGTGQHPTQALLDLYTIRDAFGRIDGLHVAIVGDLKHGRTARSLAYLLGKYKNVTVTFVAPKALAIHEEILEYCARHGMTAHVTEELAPVLSHVDCVYMTRVQKERMPPAEYERVKSAFILTPALVATMKADAIILHPLPRVDEIPAAVDGDKRAWYFCQAENGLYVRMALLEHVLRETH
jgi:aspartate carbamoyltransferase catalytic subunit